VNAPVSLARLVAVDLRQAWATESQEFTPWLARSENIALLGDAIHMDLEVDSTEKGVGPYRADILCKDTASGFYVLIENQLEPTNHIHLGQLLTYAAGLEAATIVWVARRFTDEHRAALDWLNSITDSRFNFFGLEIELWRIGDSPVAPKFNVVSQPNDWSKTVKISAGGGSSGSLTGTQQTHLEFWTQFRQFMQDLGSPLKVGKPSTDHWKTFSVGRSGFTLFAVNGVRDNYSSVYLSIGGPNAKSFYHQILATHKEDVDKALSPLGSVLWRELPDKVESQIVIRRVSAPSSRETWPEINAWFARSLETMKLIFAPIVTKLGVDTDQVAPDAPPTA
jgi:hypothetical protein